MCRSTSGCGSRSSTRSACWRVSPVYRRSIRRSLQPAHSRKTPQSSSWRLSSAGRCSRTRPLCFSRRCPRIVISVPGCSLRCWTRRGTRGLCHGRTCSRLPSVAARSRWRCGFSPCSAPESTRKLLSSTPTPPSPSKASAGQTARRPCSPSRSRARASGVSSCWRSCASAHGSTWLLLRGSMRARRAICWLLPRAPLALLTRASSLCAPRTLAPALPAARCRLLHRRPPRSRTTLPRRRLRIGRTRSTPRSRPATRRLPSGFSTAPTVLSVVCLSTWRR
eukprot:Amastigsp_a427_14.p3 type:complete len:279 gc:universal Amastigsp_a427_14:1697-861(-)